jgi:hypothetical protein
MEACEKRFHELESYLKSFIESNSERMIKAEKEFETICNRMDRLESLSSEIKVEFNKMEFTTVSVDENKVYQQQKVK